MSHSIDAPIGYCGSNSLSPEPWYLSPTSRTRSLASHRHLGRLASATAAPTFDVACDAFGGDSGWLR